MKTEDVFAKLNGKECVVALNLIDDSTFCVKRGILEYDGQGDWVKVDDTYVNINHIVYVYAIESLNETR